MGVLLFPEKFVYVLRLFLLFLYATAGFTIIKMQNVKNFIQGKALGVAEYLTPILKVIFALFMWVMIIWWSAGRNNMITYRIFPISLTLVNCR